MITERKRAEVESRVRSLIQNIAHEDDINDFISIARQSLENYGSSLDIDAIIEEAKKK